MAAERQAGKQGVVGAGHAGADHPDTDQRIPGTVGTAFDYRVRYYLALTPLEDPARLRRVRAMSSLGCDEGGPPRETASVHRSQPRGASTGAWASCRSSQSCSNSSSQAPTENFRRLFLDAAFAVEVAAEPVGGAPERVTFGS